jgi:hypothetical protein
METFYPAVRLTIMSKPLEKFCEQDIFREPFLAMRIYLNNTRRMWSRNKESEKQSITGYEIMSSIRPSFMRSILTERFNGYESCIVLQNANALPLHPNRG